MNLKYQRAYAFIPNDNLPSIKTVLKIGFQKISDADRVGILKIIKKQNNGHLGIYSYVSKK